jgi:hypothetical protein
VGPRGSLVERTLRANWAVQGTVQAFVMRASPDQKETRRGSGAETFRWLTSAVAIIRISAVEQIRKHTYLEAATLGLRAARGARSTY